MYFRLGMQGLAGALMLGCAGAAVAQPISIVDQVGRTVTLEKPAEGVVTIPIPMGSTVIALDGGTDRLAGMHPQALDAIKQGILGRVLPEALNISGNVVGNGFMPNVEELAKLSPDLVVQWGNQGDDIVNPLVNAGLNTLLITYGDESNAREYMTNVATAIGKADVAEAHIAWRDEVMADIRAKTEGLSEDKRPKILYLLRSIREISASGAPGDYNNWYIDMVGGQNAAAELPGRAQVNREQIAQWNPDIILLNGQEADLDIGWVHNDPILSMTNAAKGNQVYKMPLGGYRWDPPSHESPLSWMWLANLTHPELFSYDLRTAMRDAYKRFYSYDLTDADIDSILWMDKQGATAGYASFAR